MNSNTIKEFMLEQPDGVRLYTVLQLPEPEGKFPLIIVRTPYAATEVDLESLKTEDTHGYAILHQHCRGTGKIEGICIAYQNERKDGLFFCLTGYVASRSIMENYSFLEAVIFPLSISPF